jgi:AcrR family transcriptional regulator
VTPTTPTAQRARALAPEERRQTLVDATLRAIHEHRCVPSTRQIAQAAGVAEGTIFRAFGTKEELVDAAVAEAFDPGPFEERIAQIDPALPLRERVVALATCLQDRFRDVFELMEALRMTSPPTEHHSVKAQSERHRELSEQLVDLVRPDAAALRVSPKDLVTYVRLLTFSGSHPAISHGNPLTPEEIASVLLDGVLIDTTDEGRA